MGEGSSNKATVKWEGMSRSTAFNLPNDISIKIFHSIKGLGQTCVLLFQQKLNKTNLLEGSEVEFFLETYSSKNGPFNNFLV